MTQTPSGQAAEAVARDSYGRLIAFLASRTGDVAGAEDALSDALAAALAEWPVRGVPANPAAWIAQVARRKQIDAFRRGRTAQQASDHMILLADELDEAQTSPDALPDQRLALMFVCAHPAIDPAVRAPLMLRTVLGLDTATIAAAFLTAPSAMAQRLVRARSRIQLARIPFVVPEPEERLERLDAVLDAIYAAFAAGWTDPAGTDPRRRDLAGEAIWLARLIVSLLPSDAEAHGLLALMLYAEARRAARRGPDGVYVPLAEQDPAAWDAAMIAEAETTLRRAGALGVLGRFQLEAAVQSAHAVRRQTGHADWDAIERLYEALEALTGSPVVTINRAVAVAEVRGPDRALAMLDGVAGDERLLSYQPYWAARAGLLTRAGAAALADDAYARAIALEADPAVRAFLMAKRAKSR